MQLEQDWLPSQIGDGIVAEAALLSALVHQLRRTKNGMVEMSEDQLDELFDRIEDAHDDLSESLDKLRRELRRREIPGVIYEW